MKVIQLDRYLPELSAMYSFYRYSELAFRDQGLRKDILQHEFSNLYQAALPYVKENAEKPGDWQKLFAREIEKKVQKEIAGGLIVLRRQILEASHSIFEKYLCHVVRVYFHNFPEILMDIEKNVPFRVIAELKDNSSIFDYAVEREVDHFSRRSLQEKKDYLAKHLKHTRQDEVWLYDGEDLWKDIDQKRQAIVHKEETPEISHEYLLRAITCLQRIMMAIAIFAQTDQGVKFTWGPMSDLIRSRD